MSNATAADHAHAESAPLEFSAFAALVAAHAENMEKAVFSQSWEAFVHPTVDSAKRLLLAQELVAGASDAEFKAGVESMRFGSAGYVLLRRSKNLTTDKFEYKLQLCRMDPRGQTTERDVALSTIVTAVRGGLSLLAAALAEDQEFALEVRAFFLKGEALVEYEQKALSVMLEDAKTPGSTRRNSI